MTTQEIKASSPPHDTCDSQACYCPCAICREKHGPLPWQLDRELDDEITLERAVGIIADLLGDLDEAQKSWPVSLSSEDEARMFLAEARTPRDVAQLVTDGSGWRYVALTED